MVNKEQVDFRFFSKPVPLSLLASRSNASGELRQTVQSGLKDQAVLLFNEELEYFPSFKINFQKSHHSIKYRFAIGIETETPENAVGNLWLEELQ